ncbi:MAG: DinB family protein [Acidobacteriota bacterium]|nr:DinB family protein [Acidobacteriota bacterium]
MIYNSVADIYQAIDESRGRLVARLKDLNDEQQQFRPAEDVWCVAEIAEHLSISEQQMVKLVGMLLAKADTSAAAAAPAGSDGGAGRQPHAMEPFTLDHFAEQVRGVKITAPERVRPCGTIPLADSLAKMSETRAALSALRPRLEAADHSAALYPHPAFGPINAYQWLAVIGLHDERHLRQLELLLETTDERRES